MSPNKFNCMSLTRFDYFFLIGIYQDLYTCHPYDENVISDIQKEIFLGVMPPDVETTTNRLNRKNTDYKPLKNIYAYPQNGRLSADPNVVTQ